jgi:hypothetical protein
MLSLDRIEQVRSRTHVSTMEAVHALTIAGGDVARAIDELHDHVHTGNRSVVASSREHAQRLATALVDAGIWVAVGAYPRLRALNSVCVVEDAKVPVAA